jgi:Ca2+-binding RTX toxin-like protein
MATFNGTPGPDVLRAGAEADILNGGAGGDVLFGEGNNDTLNGDAGDDVLDGGPGSDNLNGGAGFDAANYVNSGAGVVVTLQAGAVVMEGTSTGGGGADTLNSIEAVHGSNLNDTLRVISRHTDEIFLRGNGGADTLEGPSTPGASVWATYFTAKQGIVATFDPSGPGYRFTVQDGTPAGAAAFSTDTLINIWSLAGGDFGDKFTGGDDAERFLGRAGSDVIDGKGGSDFAEYEESPLAIFVNLASGFALDGYGTTDTLLNIENVRASNRSDYIIGSGAANILLALEGNDTIEGGAGADQIVGAEGTDTAAYAGSTAGVVVSLAAGTASGGHAAGDVLSGIENLTGSGLADALTGDSGVNILSGGAGADVLDGGAGNDRLDGGLGIDTMIGGSGNDTYLVDSSREVIAEGAGQGFDTVLAGASHILSAGAEIEVLCLLAPSAKTKITLTGNNYANAITGGSGVNSIKGNGGNDTLDAAGGKDSVNGGAGNDRIDGGRGQDTLTGGKGRDVFEFDKGETSTKAKTADYITDFSARQRDKVDLQAIDANVKAKGNQAFKFIGYADFTKAGQVRYEKVGKATYLSYNTDGDSAAEGVIKVKGAMDFHKGWFVL